MNNSWHEAVQLEMSASHQKTSISIQLQIRRQFTVQLFYLAFGVVVILCVLSGSVALSHQNGIFRIRYPTKMQD